MSILKKFNPKRKKCCKPQGSKFSELNLFRNGTAHKGLTISAKFISLFLFWSPLTLSSVIALAKLQPKKILVWFTFKALSISSSFYTQSTQNSHDSNWSIELQPEFVVGNSEKINPRKTSWFCRFLCYVLNACKVKKNLQNEIPMTRHWKLSKANLSIYNKVTHCQALTANACSVHSEYSQFHQTVSIMSLLIILYAVILVWSTNSGFVLWKTNIPSALCLQNNSRHRSK